MWNELASYKNRFLQNRTKYVKPELINTLVFTDLKQQQELREQCQPEYKLACQHSTWFDDHAQLAYGWFALPKLIREMCSADGKTHWRAINSLSEFLLNPLQAQRAITELDLLRRLKNTYMRTRRRRKYKEDFRITDRLLQCFNILATYDNGANKIVRMQLISWDLYKIILTNEGHKEKAAEILRKLSEKPEVLLFQLEETDAFDRLTEIFLRDPCSHYHPVDLWMHLSHFLEIAPEKGLEKGLFELFLLRINGRLPAYHRHNMKCFAFLLRCEEGQRKFFEIDGVSLMHTILKTSKFMDTAEYVVLALQNGVLTKRVVMRCREFTDLPDILVNLATKTSNPRLQAYCLKTLRLIGELPCIKQYTRAALLSDLMAMNCLSEDLECTRDAFCAWLKREIYDTCE